MGIELSDIMNISSKTKYLGAKQTPLDPVNATHQSLQHDCHFCNTHDRARAGCAYDFCGGSDVVSMMAARAITTIRRLRRPTHAGIVVMALAAIIMTLSHLNNYMNCDVTTQVLHATSRGVLLTFS